MGHSMAGILVIDDDRSVLHFVSEIFKESDIKVLTAENGERGLEILQREKPHVALIDIMLRETSGLRLFDRIRHLDPRLPVIYITASGTSDTAIEAMKTGAYDYL